MRTFLALSLLCCIYCLCFSTGNGLELVLKRYNRQVQCNSVIDISRVGREYSYYYSWRSRSTNEGPLVCYTQDPYCCRAQDDPYEGEETGEWVNPQGEDVGSSQSYGRFYITRGHQELSLHSYYANAYTGVYCCEIQSVNASNNTMDDGSSGMGSGSGYNYTTNSTCCVGLYSSYQINRCSSLSISHGQVSYDSAWIPGRVATYSCNRGFKLIGNPSRTCTSSRWSGSPPSCSYDCGRLAHPLNGRVDTHYGTTEHKTATYSCNKGYHLVGSSTRTCQYYSSSRYYYRSYESGWSDSPAYCVDTAKIQVKFTLGQNCMLWESRKASTVESTLRSAIRQALIESNHPLLENNTEVYDIIPQSGRGVFSCREQTTDTTYRTTIFGLEGVSAKVVTKVIQRWVSKGASVQIEWYLVDIDKKCPVRISSEFDPECIESYLNPEGLPAKVHHKHEQG